MAGPYPVVIGTSPVQAVAYNKDRTSLTIQNVSDADMYLGYDVQVTVSNGIKLIPGEKIAFSFILGDDPRIPYYLVSGSTGKQATILDGFRGYMPPQADRGA